MSTPVDATVSGSSGKTVPWLAWAATGATLAATTLAVLWVLQRTALQGARAVVSRQQDDLEWLSAEHTAGIRQRDEALAEARVALAAAVAAGERAETTLAGTRELAERIFGSFLEAAAQLPADGERHRLLLDGYEYFSRFVATHGDRPELAESVLHARCHLASVKLALGSRAEAADRFDDARARLIAFLAAHPDHPRAAALRLRAAECLLEAGRLRLEAMPPEPGVAENLASALTEITAAAEAAGHPPELARRVAEGELVLAEADSTRTSADIPGATARVQTAIDRLRQLLGDPQHSQPGDKIRLGRALLLRGLFERRGGATELALATQVETARILLECGDQPEALALLARCYHETGAMLEANGEANDALRAHGEAVKILTDLVRGAPERTDHRLDLAARYGDLARILRQQDQAPRAIDYQQGAVDLVQALLTRDAANTTIATTLAGLRADLADLMADLGQKADALAQARETVILLDRLSPPTPATTPAETSDRLAIARSYAVAGGAAEKMQQVDEARSFLEKAVAHYEAAAAASPADPAVGQGLSDCRTRLTRLAR